MKYQAFLPHFVSVGGWLEGHGVGGGGVGHVLLRGGWVGVGWWCAGSGVGWVGLVVVWWGWVMWGSGNGGWVSRWWWVVGVVVVALGGVGVGDVVLGVLLTKG